MFKNFTWISSNGGKDSVSKRLSMNDLIKPSIRSAEHLEPTSATATVLTWAKTSRSDPWCSQGDKLSSSTCISFLSCYYFRCGSCNDLSSFLFILCCLLTGQVLGANKCQSKSAKLQGMFNWILVVQYRSFPYLYFLASTWQNLRLLWYILL